MKTKNRKLHITTFTETDMYFNKTYRGKTETELFNSSIKDMERCIANLKTAANGLLDLSDIDGQIAKSSLENILYDYFTICFSFNTPVSHIATTKIKKIIEENPSKFKTL